MRNEQINKVFSKFSDAIRPAEKMDVIPWVKKNVVFPKADKPNADLRHKPHMIEPFRALTSGDYKIVNLQSPTGSGKTALIEMLLVFYAEDGASSVVTFNDQSVAQNFMEARLQPTLAASKCTKDMYAALGRNDKTVTQIKYPSHDIRVAHATIKNLQSYSARIIINDEVVFWRDKGLLKEAYARTHRRWNALIFNCSQPLDQDDEFDVECQKGEMMRYSWLCDCGCRNVWNWQDINYDTVWIDEEQHTVDWPATYDTISMSCPECDATYLDKPVTRRKLADGSIFVSDNNPHTPEVITFNFPIIADRSAPWSDTVQERIQAGIAIKKGDIEPLKQFIQKQLAIPWQDRDNNINIDDVITNPELTLADVKPRDDKYKYRIAGVDVQGGNNQELYWYIVIRDWADNGSSRLVYAARLGENPDEIPKLVKDYKVDDVWMDAGYQDRDVLEFAAKHKYLTFDAKKQSTWTNHGGKLGSQPYGKPVAHATKNGVAYKYTFVAEVFKDILGKFRSGMGMPWEIPHNVSKSYKYQIMGEQRKADKNGDFSWQQVRKDNHCFDCEVAILMVVKMKGIL